MSDDGPDPTGEDGRDEPPQSPAGADHLGQSGGRGTGATSSDGTAPGHERGVADAAERDATDAAAGDLATGTEVGEQAAEHRSRHEGRTFGRRGWLLVAWMVLALVVIPAYLFFYPRASETLAPFGLGYRDTFLVLPLVPALVLGALAVWATTRP